MRPASYSNRRGRQRRPRAFIPRKVLPTPDGTLAVARRLGLSALLAMLFCAPLPAQQIPSVSEEERREAQEQARARQQHCNCLWRGSFAEVAPNTDLVIAGEVLRRKGNSVDLRIIEPLRGPDYLDEVRVWMQARDYCRPPAEEFPEGSRWVMALQRIREVPEGGFDPSTPNISYGRVDDYLLSSCGGYWLAWEGEAVTGNLVNAPRWAREVEMTPVLLSLVKAFLQGDTDAEALAEASREDPALRDLKLDTKQFLRGYSDE